MTHRHVADAVTVVELAARAYRGRYKAAWSLPRLPEALGLAVEARETGGPVLGLCGPGRGSVWCPPRLLASPLAHLEIGRLCTETLLDRVGAAPHCAEGAWYLLARLIVSPDEADDVARGRILPADVARDRVCPPELVRLRLRFGDYGDGGRSAVAFEAWVRAQLDCLEGACGFRAPRAPRRGEDDGERPEASHAERPFSRGWPFRPGDVRG